jgi:hypothetical protein
VASKVSITIFSTRHGHHEKVIKAQDFGVESSLFSTCRRRGSGELPEAAVATPLRRHTRPRTPATRAPGTRRRRPTGVRDALQINRGKIGSVSAARAGATSPAKEGAARRRNSTHQAVAGEGQQHPRVLDLGAAAAGGRRHGQGRRGCAGTNGKAKGFGIGTPPPAAAAVREYCEHFSYVY